MSLENIKNNRIVALRILMALVFLGAGLFRIFNPGAANLELMNLKLPLFFGWPIIILEILGGLCLLLNYKAGKMALMLGIFLILALLQALIINGAEIWRQAGELFVFKANSLDWFLHLVFLVILGSVFWGRRN